MASRYGSFPILVETYRECLSDVFDLPALRDVLAGVERREVAVHRVETVRASPFASSLLFDYVAAYMYEGDAPLAERRAQALTLDRDLLRELLGQEELRELLDPAALAELELALQALVDERQATTVDQVHDLLRRLGDLTEAEVAARGAAAGAATAPAWLASWRPAGGRSPSRIAGEARWIAIEDAARYRDAIGVQPPAGVAARVPRPDGRGARGAARPLGPDPRPVPVAPSRPSAGGFRSAIVEEALARLVAAGSLLRGEFRPGGAEREWCDPEVLRQLRRRSLARLRREVEPVEPAALGRFLPAWQGVAALPGSAAGRRRRRRRPRPGRARAPRRGRRPAGRAADPGVGPRARRPAGPDPRLPAAAARRARRARRGRLGRLRAASAATTGGSRSSGRAAEVLRRGGRRPASLEAAAGERPDGPRHAAIRALLARRGASFYREIFAAAGGGPGPRDARRAVGPRLGGRGHERHVRAAPGAALEAARAGGRAAGRAA